MSGIPWESTEMNYFFLDTNTKRSAAWLDDLRANNQIRETGQLLSTAVRVKDPRWEHLGGLYRSTHENHPVTKWVQRSPDHFQHLMRYFYDLSVRFGRAKTSGELHGTFRRLHPLLVKWQTVRMRYVDWPARGFVPCNCAADQARGLDFKHIKPTEEAYRNYICEKWKTDVRPPSWEQPGAERPEWFMGKTD